MLARMRGMQQPHMAGSLDRAVDVLSGGLCDAHQRLPSAWIERLKGAAIGSVLKSAADEQLHTYERGSGLGYLGQFARQLTPWHAADLGLDAA